MSAEPVPIIDGQLKRVILCLRYNEFEDDDKSHIEAIETYLAAVGRDVEEYKSEDRYVSHVEMRQDYMEGNPKASFHVTLDLEKHAVENPDLNQLPHEIYSIRRREDGTR